MEWQPPGPSPPTPEELAAYIGPKADAYRSRFDRFTRGGAPGFELSWNWPAFFAGAWWYLYRKMYWWAILDLGVSLLLGWTVFVPVLWAAARAVTGNYLYFRWTEWKIREARPRISGGSAPGDASHLARLAREGGVHAWVPWVAVAGMLLLIALGSLFFGMLLDAIPPLRDIWPRGPGHWT
jgi:hypothetical protein